MIIKEVLKSNRKSTSSEFIQALQDKGINVLFNQASTGYVSGISYSIKGFTISGSKLGRDFKWTSIKNTIDYEQERDRQTIHEANVRTKSWKVNSYDADQVSAHKSSTRLTSQKNENNDPVFSKSINLPRLLDGQPHWDSTNPDNQPDIDPHLKPKRRRKKRRWIKM